MDKVIGRLGAFGLGYGKSFGARVQARAYGMNWEMTPGGSRYSSKFSGLSACFSACVYESLEYLFFFCLDPEASGLWALKTSRRC